jgi:putative ABC transport system ATP-binding protein
MLICESLSKHYRTSKGTVRSLDQVDLKVDRGEFLVIRGHSGSGKTTLLLTLGAMLHPTGGKVVFDGKHLYDLPQTERARIRARSIGFVFQMFHLIPYLSVVDNALTAVEKPSDLESMQRAKTLLGELGLGDRLEHFPHQLSAGEKQRAALARAMMPNPDLILADEPTGNLDPENAVEVCRHLKQFQEQGGTVVFVTHGDAAAAFASRTITLKNGKLLSNSDVSPDAASNS